jgi:vacuolar iron transporter family protein
LFYIFLKPNLGVAPLLMAAPGFTLQLRLRPKAAQAGVFTTIPNARAVRKINFYWYNYFKQLILGTTFCSMVNLDTYLKKHYIHRSNWLRAAVLGANDGIISVASLAVGIASANATRDTLLLATVAGVVAGALSMAAGEYVSVSTQTDIENADIEREKQELNDTPAEELELLAHIYELRGLKKETARQVAVELTENDALAAHVRDELGITESSKANPLQAALASGGAFILGGAMPLIVTLLAPLANMVYYLYIFTILFLIILGVTSAKTGGAKIYKAVLRVTIWGTVAMVAAAIVGKLFNVPHL